MTAAKHIQCALGILGHGWLKAATENSFNLLFRCQFW